ncbi:MAG: ABC transporter permease [Acidobacteria bacterium]|nr:ABC transporter permease [Acidobacteriota bacterium]
MQTIWQDVTYAVRSLLRAPGFAAVTILTLALGIGANTAVFTVVNAIVLRPLPYPAADRLVMLWQDLSQRGGPADEWASPGNFVDWTTSLPALERVAAIGGWRPTLTGDAEPEALGGEQVSHEYLTVLRRAPALGRDFAAADDVPNARRVAIISDGLWRRRFGGDPSAVGRLVVLAGEPHEIIGVLPPAFRPVVAPDADVWRPLRLDRANPSRGLVVLRTVARLAEGVTLAQAQGAATALAARLEAEHPDDNARTGFLVQPLGDRVTGQIRPALVALAGAVAFVLLIACANIANLLLARASGRRRELATRVALGASRGRMVRQLATESLVVAAAGGAVGLLLGIWGVDALVALAPADAPRLDEVRVDAAVFAATALLALATGLLVGLAPALQQSFTSVAPALKDGGRGTAGGSSGTLRRVLVTAEVALALVLVTGGALFVETFVRLQSADLGFRTDGLLLGAIFPTRTSYDTPEKTIALYDQVLERVAAIPGVEQAALSSVLPLDGGDSDMSFAIEGRPAVSVASEVPVAWYRLVSAGYFEAIGMRIVRGRSFADREPAPSVVVNETFVRRYFPGEDPLGRRLRFGAPDRPAFTIVGVVADVSGRGAREDTRVETFVPYRQMPERGMNIVLRGPIPGSWPTPLRQAVGAIDPGLPVVGVQTMAERVGVSISQPRFLATLSGGFAGLALILAALGIYGVMAYAVAQRTAEIGVRMALGASTTGVFRLVVGDGVKLAAAGLVLGVTGAVFAARAIATQLFGVEPTDPLRLAVTAAVVVGVVVAACLVPARRAMRVDPLEALRAE